MGKEDCGLRIAEFWFQIDKGTRDGGRGISGCRFLVAGFGILINAELDEAGFWINAELDEAGFRINAELDEAGLRMNAELDEAGF